LQASKKKALPTLLTTTRGLPSRAVATALTSLSYHARPRLEGGSGGVGGGGAPHAAAPSFAAAGSGSGAGGTNGTEQADRENGGWVGGSDGCGPGWVGIGPKVPSVLVCNAGRLNLLGLGVGGGVGAAASLSRRLDRGFDRYSILETSARYSIYYIQQLWS